MANTTLTPAVRAYLRSIGAKGGRKTSPEKTAAARRNAALPRPGRKKAA